MTAERLWAKSDGRGNGVLTLLEHTQDVVGSIGALVDRTGEAQLAAIGLDPVAWLPRFRRDARIAGLLHDLGKCSSQYQSMLLKKLESAQSLRHEAVSFWIATRPEMLAWLAENGWSGLALEIILWAVGGHHRKFPPARREAADEPFLVHLSHADFHATLEWGRSELMLTPAPRLGDATLFFEPARRSIHIEFDDHHADARHVFSELTAEEARYQAALKACLIGADVAGSIRLVKGRTIVDWLPEAFANVPLAEEFERIVERRLKGGDLRPFQARVASLDGRVVYIRAGCGSGKTIAAYLWAARRHPGRRLFICYPTMGTATEGYRDYLRDADLDKRLVHGRAEIDMKLLGLGDDEPDEAPKPGDGPRPGEGAGPGSNDSSALDLWSTPVVSCTVDTVLGLLQNHRRGIQAWPSIAGSAIVFDEIHSFDDSLFDALLRFLVELRGIPCLLMTASLPLARLRRIREALLSIGETLGELDGPPELEGYKRYRRERRDDPWPLVLETLDRGEKVLWVVNTVDRAIELAEHEDATRAGAILYHSRFRYLDRLDKHGKLIDRFGVDGPTLAITTQVAEMSLDLSAHLLVTELSPIPSLIQRLGRLNRRASSDDPWPFFVVRPKHSLPYDDAELVEAEAWLEALGDGPLSQADLVAAWRSEPPGRDRADKGQVWFDGGFVTGLQPLREASPSVAIILGRDREDVLSKRRRPEEVRIPMPVPRGRGWRDWPEVAFSKVPPDDAITYDENKGARWKTP